MVTVDHYECINAMFHNNILNPASTISQLYQAAIPIIVGVVDDRTANDDERRRFEHTLAALLSSLRQKFGNSVTLLVAGRPRFLDHQSSLLAGVPLATLGYMRLPSVDEGPSSESSGDAGLRIDYVTPASSVPARPHDPMVIVHRTSETLIQRSHILILQSSSAHPDGLQVEVMKLLIGGQGIEPTTLPEYHSTDSTIFQDLFDDRPRPSVIRVLPASANNGDDDMPPFESMAMCRMYDDDDQEYKLSVTCEESLGVANQHIISLLSNNIVADLERIRQFNEEMLTSDKADQRIFGSQLDDLRLGFPDHLADQVRYPAWKLSAMQAGTDTVAQRFQRKLLGAVPAASGIKDLIARLRRFYRAHRVFPPLGAQVKFAAIIPLVVLFFELYAHADWKHALPIYIIILVWGVMYYILRVHSESWQSKFQDYRALAEAIRVQYFWALSGYPGAVCDNYFGKQRRELGWIRRALYGPALYGMALATQVHSSGKSDEIRFKIVNGWINAQADYFENRHRLYDRASHNSQKYLYTCLIGGGTMVLGLILYEFSEHEIHSEWWHSISHNLKHGLMVLAASAPAFAAFFGLVSETRAYESHARNYKLMHHVFLRALYLARAITPPIGKDDVEFERLIVQLGREALNETTEWLIDHRNRPVEFRAQ